MAAKYLTLILTLAIVVGNVPWLLAETSCELSLAGASPLTFSQFVKDHGSRHPNGKNEPRAVPRGVAVPIVAAPVVMEAALQALAATVSVALAIHIISQVTHDEYQAKISKMIAKVKHASRAALITVQEAVATLYDQIRGELNDAAKLGPIDAVGQVCPASRIAKGAATESSVSVKPRSTALPCYSPKECCKEFIAKFSERVFQKGRSLKVYENATAARKRSKPYDCCLQFDGMHGGAWEIFSTGGKHLGERSCDDFDDDPCALTANRGAHGLPDGTGAHAVRNDECREQKSAM